MLMYINRNNTYLIKDDETREMADLGVRLFDFLHEQVGDYDLEEVVRVTFLNGGVATDNYIELCHSKNNKYTFQSFSYVTKAVMDKGKIHTAYEVFSEQDIAFVELITLIMNNSKINQCKRCGKLFVLKNNHISSYCDRLDSVVGVPCSRLGSAEAYKEKLTKNVILQEYQKAYKRLYARVRSDRMEQADFNAWVQETTEIRDRMAQDFEQTGDIRIVEEFKQIVQNKK